jgi:hypothetical protein
MLKAFQSRLSQDILVESAVICIVGLISLTWFRGNTLIEWKDWIFPLSNEAVDRSFEVSTYAWDGIVTGLGIQSHILFPTVIYHFFLWLFSHLGFSMPTINKALFYFLFTLSGLSMYYLMLSITNRKWILARVGGALFYMMNPFSMTFVWGDIITSYIFSYPIVPLVIALYIRAIKNEGTVKQAFVISILWTLVGSNNANPEITLIIWLFLLAYLVFAAVSSKNMQCVYHFVRFTLVLLLIFSGINAFWMVSSVYFIGETFQRISREWFGESDIGAFRSNSVPVIGALRLTGFWAVNSKYRGDPYYLWASTFSTPVFQTALFLLPLLAFFPLLFMSKFSEWTRKHIIFFALVSIFGILMIVGSNPPFGNLLEWMFQQSPFLLRLYRAPYQRFGIFATTGYSFLIGIGLQVVTDGTHKLTARRFSHFTKSQCFKVIKLIPSFFLVFILFGLLAYPFWTGDIINSGGIVTPSARVQVPSYYNEAASFFKSDQDDFNLLSLPLGLFAGTVLKWNNGSDGYFADNPDAWLFNKPAIIYSGQGNGLAGLFAHLVIDNPSFQLGSLSGWEYEKTSGNPTISIDIYGSKYVAKISFPNGSNRLNLYRKTFYSVKEAPINFIVTAKTISGAAVGNLVVWYYNTSSYISAYTSEMFPLSNFRPVATDLTKVAEIKLQQSWFMGTDASFSNNAWYFHIKAFQSPIRVEIYFQGSGYIDVASDKGILVPRIFVENKSMLLDLNPKNVSWFEPRVYSKNNNISLITVKLVDPAPTANALFLETKDQGLISASLLNTPINGSLFFRPGITVTNVNDEPSEVLVIGSFLESYDLVSANELAKILTLMNVKYIVLHGDADWDYIKDNPWWITPNSFEDLQNALNSQEGIRLLKRIGDLYIYQNNLWKPFHLYSTTRFFVGTGGIEQLPEVIRLANTSFSGSAFFLSNQLEQSKVDFINSLKLDEPSNIQITVHKVNPTKFIINVNSSTSFFLVFSELYHKDWVAYVDGRQIPNKYHFIANGYANAWYINKTGTYTITLEFWPQKLFYIGSAISITTLILCVAYISKNKIKTIYQTIRQKTSQKPEAK